MNKLNKLTSIEEKRYWFLRDFFLGTYTSKQALEKAQWYEEKQKTATATGPKILAQTRVEELLEYACLLDKMGD